MRLKPTDTQVAAINACLSLGIPFFWRTPGTLLIEQQGVEELAQELSKEGYTVLGFEGFAMNALITPQFDFIVNVEEHSSVESALQIVREWDPKLWIDVTIS